MNRRLAAEVRAVEEGHHARLLEDGRYAVTSDTTDETWHVEVIRRVGVIYFKCTCPAGRHDLLCKHSQLVARRLEREGTAELQYGAWVDPTYEAPVFEGDPFEGLA